MVENLPEGSQFHAEILGGPEFRPWNTQTYLMANIINAINTNTLVLSNASKSDRAKVKLINGPEIETNTREKDTAETRAFLERFGVV